MIPNTTPGVAAQIKGSSGEPVIAWGEDGHPLVMDLENKIVPAREVSGFKFIDRDEQRIIQIMPADGWTVTWNPDAVPPERHTVSIAGWGLCADGQVFPMVADHRGVVELLIVGKFRINPPEVLNV